MLCVNLNFKQFNKKAYNRTNIFSEYNYMGNEKKTQALSILIFKERSMYSVLYRKLTTRLSCPRVAKIRAKNSIDTGGLRTADIHRYVFFILQL